MTLIFFQSTDRLEIIKITKKKKKNIMLFFIFDRPTVSKRRHKDVLANTLKKWPPPHRTIPNDPSNVNNPPPHCQASCVKYMMIGVNYCNGCYYV